MREERRVLVFVIRPDRSIVQVDIGPYEPVVAAVEGWRKNIGGSGKLDNTGASLRRLVWAPVEVHAEGVHTVLFSPDGILARLSLAALPGKQPGTYLIEERSFAVVPIPQLLPEHQRAPTPNLGEPSLLLIGDVDYDVKSGEVEPQGDAMRDDQFRKWHRLAGTREEILLIKDSFERHYPKAVVTVLRGSAATEMEFRRQAPRHQYLHVATHGFFAPPQLSSTQPSGRAPAKQQTRGIEFVPGQGIASFHPDLMSGLVLAGANQPAKPGQDDGILTALEVSSLNLEGVELVVLSACETGLGESADGEGQVGLQRAFQLAGARTTVASLWQLSDRATQLLMADFHDNLWRKQLPKAEAMRQAQLTMLKEGGARRLERLDGSKPDGSRRLPPFYWAGFVLSGDWR